MSVIPLGSLRTQIPAWREDRSLRPAATLPMLYADQAEVVSEVCNYLRPIFPDFGYLFAFSPTFDLWFKPFAEWTEADWRHPDNRSYLLNIKAGKVTVAQGALTLDEMKSQGQPYDQFARSANPQP